MSEENTYIDGEMMEEKPLETVEDDIVEKPLNGGGVVETEEVDAPGKHLVVKSNVTVRGRAKVCGSAIVGGNLKVRGWLDAPNIKGILKGIFTTLADLERTYPYPYDGWLAGIGTSTPYTAYVGHAGKWEATGGTIELNVDMSQIADEIEAFHDEFTDDLSEFEQGINNKMSDFKEKVNEEIKEFEEGIEDNITALNEAVFPLELTFASNATLLEYTGVAQVVLLSWSIRRRGELKTPAAVSINGTSLTPSATGTAQMMANTLGVNNYVLSVTADNMTNTATRTVNMMLPIYMGFHTDGATVNAMKSALTKMVKTTPAGSYTFTNDNNAKYLTLCVPATMTINSVKSSGFDVPMQAAVIDNSIVIGGQTRQYKIYRSASPINAGNMTITVS